MVADLFHIGHLNLIRRSSEIGDYLIVGIHSDKSVESYKRKPIIEDSQRYEIVKSCRYVDEVVEDAPLVITRDFIEQNSIDCVVHGDDISTEVKRQHKIPFQMRMVKYLPRTEGISTTEIIERVRRNDEER
jgi:ethanolamine-phosphate cytidylyltransferase